MQTEPVFDVVAIYRALNRHEVDYIVVGGFAVATHGVIRATVDLDIVVDHSWANAERLGAALAELDAVDATGASTPLTQEVLVRRESRLFDTKHGPIHILNRIGTVPPYADLLPAQRFEVDGEPVLVATVEQLRAMKSSTGRTKDQLDIEELGEVS